MSESTEQTPALAVEPTPVQNSHPEVVTLVLNELPSFAMAPEVRAALVTDLEARRRFGKQKYGTALQPFNGRNAVVDLYQELLDGLQYARQAVFEAQQLGNPWRAETMQSIYVSVVTEAANVRAIILDMERMR